jgi:hypothetical protein
MSDCQRCKSARVIKFNGKSGDLSSVWLGGKEHDGYVPSDMNIGGGDYVRFYVCLDCGQMQGNWPVPRTDMEDDGE